MTRRTRYLAALPLYLAIVLAASVTLAWLGYLLVVFCSWVLLSLWAERGRR